MAEKVDCATRLIIALTVRQMTQAELCRKTGIPKSAMSQYCNGKFEPKQDRVSLMAKALEVNEAWLMGFDVPMTGSMPPPLVDSLQGPPTWENIRKNPKVLAGVVGFLAGCSGKNLEELEKETGLQPSHWGEGGIIPSVEDLEKYEAALGVSLEIKKTMLTDPHFNTNGLNEDAETAQFLDNYFRLEEEDREQIRDFMSFLLQKQQNKDS